MCECETVSNGSCFAKCKTKRNVIDVYMSHFNRLREVAQQQYAIDSMEFLSYVPIGPDYVQHFERRQRQRRRHLCHHSDANANTLFSATSLKYFAQFVVQCIRAQFKRYFVHIVICATVIVLVNYRTEATNAFMRNIQTSIYPMMRGWRKITLPLIGLFPVLTELYDETCLIENPLFRVANLDCTPCTGIAKVTEHVASFPFTQFEYSVPHIVQVRPIQLRDDTNNSFKISLPGEAKKCHHHRHSSFIVRRKSHDFPTNRIQSSFDESKHPELGSTV